MTGACGSQLLSETCSGQAMQWRSPLLPAWPCSHAWLCFWGGVLLLGGFRYVCFACMVSGHGLEPAVAQR